jgi:hypothetical protein
MNDQLAVFIDFENVALWAEREFFDFEITGLMEYLQMRGPAVVKRAYGDWSRFSRYRDEMMNNSIDLIQIYSLRAGKNRADIRMAIDAFEIAMTRPSIRTYVVVSGDSDFSPLVAKLREYGYYTIGIGPRSITHELLVKSCDEFVYLETALGEPGDVDDQSCVEIEQARNLLVKALQAHEQRGDVPVLATRLKQTMLLMDPAFNEVNIGYSQFKGWLDDNRDLVQIYLKELQIFVAPLDYIQEEGMELAPVEKALPAISPKTRDFEPVSRPSLSVQYRQTFTRLKMNSVDMATRRDVLRDIYREVSERPGELNSDELLDQLSERYEAQELARNRNAIREITQLAIHQEVFDFRDEPVSMFAPIWMAGDIQSEADFIERCESDFIFALIRTGIDIDLEEMAYLLVNDRQQHDYIQEILDDLQERGKIIQKGSHYTLPGRGIAPFEDEPALQILLRDIELTPIPGDVPPGADSARALAKKAMLQRSQDFAASTHTYQLACRIQWDAIISGEPGATLDELRWYMASYASAIAGKLSQVNRDYSAARPYYLAFFALVQEEDALWSRMRGLINPMLSYYWSNAGRELDINVSAWNQSMSSPAQIAVFAATHPNPDLRRLWQHITLELAKVNSRLLRRISSQLMLNRSDHPENARVAEQIEEILAEASV